MEKFNTKSKEALAWLAGFFAGEGCISMYYDGHQTFTGHVIISQRERKLLDLGCAIVEAHGIGAPEPRYSAGSHVFDLYFNRLKGSELLQLIVPFPMRAKHKKRAEIYLRMFPPGQHHVKRKAERQSIYIEWQRLRIDEKQG